MSQKRFDSLLTIEFQNAIDMRKSYRQYLGLYGVNVALLAAAPYFYAKLPQSSVEYLGQFYPLIGVVLAVSTGTILACSLRLFGSQTKLNVFYIRAMQQLREVCGYSKTTIPYVGLHAEKVPTHDDNPRPQFVIPHDVSRGYFAAIWGIGIGGVVLMTISAVPHIWALITPSYYGLLTTWAAVAFVICLGVTITMRQLSRGIIHLTEARVLTDFNPNPHVACRSLLSGNKFHIHIIGIGIIHISVAIAYAISLRHESILVNNTLGILLFLTGISAFYTLLTRGYFMFQVHKIIGIHVQAYTALDLLIRDKEFDLSKDCPKRPLSELSRRLDRVRGVGETKRITSLIAQYLRCSDAKEKQQLRKSGIEWLKQKRSLILLSGRRAEFDTYKNEIERLKSQWDIAQKLLLDDETGTLLFSRADKRRFIFESMSSEENQKSPEPVSAQASSLTQSVESSPDHATHTPEIVAHKDLVPSNTKSKNSR